MKFLEKITCYRDETIQDSCVMAFARGYEKNI